MSMSQGHAAQVLLNMMKLSEKLFSDYGSYEAMVQDNHFINRSHSIEWMKKILCNESQDFVDLSIQVFDRYISLVYATDNSCLGSTGFLCHTAACSVLLAAKLMDSGARQRINMTKFHLFNTESLISHERQILIALGSVFPLCTPRSFAALIVACCPTPVDSRALLGCVDSIVKEFEEHRHFLKFAPSTVAISSLIVGFACLHANCDDWLASVPNFCLPLEGNTLFADSPDALNIEKCTDILSELPQVLRAVTIQYSPSGVNEVV